ncbi:MAG TPA: hypothetical protein VIS48_12230 [Candidatus Kryptonia bacterium]
MGTGQTLLTVGAIMLLGMVILTVNRSLNDTSEVMVNSNIGLEEVSLATSIIEEAEGKAFDDSTKVNPLLPTQLSHLTPPSSLGQEGGVTTDLDDFDDFNGPTHTGRSEIDTLSTGIYHVFTKVYYINPANPGVPSSTTTWNKEMDVWVWNTSVPDTVKMHTIYSYWYF